jgi:FkbM family methyltransferase
LDVSEKNPDLDMANCNLNRFRLNYENIDPSGLKLAVKEDGYIKAIPLDSLMLGKIDFMKIDCENMDKLVILGAIETIKKYRPVIVFEADNPFSDIFETLKYTVTCIIQQNYLALP